MVQNKNNGIRLIGLEVLVGFRVTRLLGHGPQLLRGLCPVHVLGGGGRTCCLEHIMAERRVAKDSRYLSQPITVEYGFCCFPAIMSASHL